jgi:hypothetical protein
MSAQRAATAAQKLRRVARLAGSGWSNGRPNLEANEETLIAIRLPKVLTPALTLLRKEQLNMCRPMKQRCPASSHNDGEADCSVAAIGGWGLPDDDRQIQGAFRFAHFRAAKGFASSAGNRAPAQRPSQSHQRDTAVERHSARPPRAATRPSPHPIAR